MVKDTGAGSPVCTSVLSAQDCLPWAAVFFDHTLHTCLWSVPSWAATSLMWCTGRGDRRTEGEGMEGGRGRRRKGEREGGKVRNRKGRNGFSAIYRNFGAFY